ncbi:hypothetical protein D3C76_1598950 [compost metagenome]
MMPGGARFIREQGQGQRQRHQRPVADIDQGVEEIIPRGQEGEDDQGGNSRFC